MRKLLEKHNIPYGWLIAAYGLVAVAFSYGIGHNCFSLFIKPVTEAFGFSRQAFSVCLSIQYFLYMLISLFSGKLFKTFSVSKLMKTASVALPVTYFCLSFCHKLPLFYLCSVIIGLSIPMLSFQAFSVVVANWFKEKQGTVTGFVFMGSGLGGMIFSAIAGGLVENYGFTMTYRILAVIMAVVLIPFAFLLIREKPEDLNMEPYGVKKADGGQRAVYGATVPEALRSVRFWVLLVAAYIIGYSTGTLANCLVPHISDAGFAATYAAYINSAFLGGVSISKLIVGMMFDKIGMKKSMFISFGLLIISFAAIFFAEKQALHVVIVAGAALGCAAGSVAYPLLTKAVLGDREFVVLNGIVMAVGSLGGTICPIMNNAIYDHFRSYRPGFVIAVVLAVILLIITASMKVLEKPEEN